MAKKFMYVCFGVLALMVAFHIGAEYGKASIVDHSMPGIIASHREGSLFAVLMEDGQVWGFDGSEWNLSDDPPPVAPTEIKFWHGTYFVTYNDELWHIPPTGGWTNHGSPPTGPTVVQPTTWGAMKVMYK
jgi:hypothetical protein